VSCVGGLSKSDTPLPLLAEIHHKRPRRDPQTLAMVQGATRRFEQLPGGQPFADLRFYQPFYASLHYGEPYGENNSSMTV